MIFLTEIYSGWQRFLIVLFLLCGCSPVLKNPAKSALTRPDQEFTVRLAGDMILAVSIQGFAKRYGLDYPMKRLKSWLEGADYTVVNLESCFTVRGQPHRNKKWVFRAPPEHMQMLSSSGVDAVSLANNHLLDYGYQGLLDTLDTLNRYRIEYYGGGTNLQNAAAPLVVRLKGTPVYFLGGCSIRPADFYATARRGGTAPLDTTAMVAAIQKLKQQKCLVIVTPHWGYELRAVPNRFQQKVARALIDAGADAVIGHHPHVPQSVELYSGRPIIYSLGNCVVGFYNKGYRNNLGVTLHCRGNLIERVVFDSIAGKNLQSGFQPYIVQGAAGVRDMQYLRRISSWFKTPLHITADGRSELLLQPVRANQY